jgi:hypothetical protein
LLVAVALLAATVQGGVIAPRFDPVGGGDFGTPATSSAFNVLQNASWRSWTITGIRWAADQSPSVLAKVRHSVLSVHAGGNGQGPARSRISVGPGQTFTVNLLRPAPKCDHQLDLNPTPTQIQESEQALLNEQFSVGAVLSVVTPFGTRTVGTTFQLNC